LLLVLGGGEGHEQGKNNGRNSCPLRKEEREYHTNAPGPAEGNLIYISPSPSARLLHMLRYS